MTLGISHISIQAMPKPILFASIAALVALSACDGENQKKSTALATPATATNFPQLTGRVVDEAQLLRPDQELDLAARSQALEAQTGRQFVIVTVRSLRGRDAATYTRDLGNTWRIGRKGYNDGTILLVAPTEREVRIATGDGLATAFPDRAAKQVIEGVMLPRFRKGEISAGIVAGADAIVAQLSRHPNEAIAHPR
ncbi:TPM domain-containing protein [Sphingomonas sediminicola]|uniref:TPM domain-containing protein n=1 Tax=Sphingomonas sediminicola TaxID=386874 RepID=A0ABX6TAL9_9SPHN|nr:TPM domain-containing protein [Sphingomonas sediminicola]QNP45987.1 TPM domain-containing protein [Sphingomonas sediminicola]